MANTVTDLPADTPIGPLARGSVRPITIQLTQAGSIQRYSLQFTTRLLCEIRAAWQTDADTPLRVYDSATGGIDMTDRSNGEFQILRQNADLAADTFPAGYPYRYAIREFPSEDIVAQGPWLVAEAGVSSS